MNWEVVNGKQVNYWMLSPRGFVVGTHYGSGHTDNASHYTVAEMLDPLKAYRISQYHLPPKTTYKSLLEGLIISIKEEEALLGDAARPRSSQISEILAFIESLEVKLAKGEALSAESVVLYHQKMALREKIEAHPNTNLLWKMIETYEAEWEAMIRFEQSNNKRPAIIDELTFQKTLFIALIEGISQKENKSLRMWQFRRLSVLKTKARIFQLLHKQAIQHYNPPHQEAIWQEIIQEKGRFELKNWEEAIACWETQHQFSNANNAFLETVSLVLNGSAHLMTTITETVAYSSFEAYWASMFDSNLLTLSLQHFYTHQFQERRALQQIIQLESPLVKRASKERHEIHEISAIDCQQLLIALISTKKRQPTNLNLFSLSAETTLQVSFSNPYTEKKTKVDDALAFFEHLATSNSKMRYYWLRPNFYLGYDELGGAMYGPDLNALYLVAYSDSKQHILLVNGSD